MRFGSRLALKRWSLPTGMQRLCEFDKNLDCCYGSGLGHSVDRPYRRAGCVPSRVTPRRRDAVTLALAIAPLPIGGGLVLGGGVGGGGRIDQAEGAGTL